MSLSTLPLFGLALGGFDIDWIALLRKLGILRYGTKGGTYISGKEMPAEFLMDGVYDAEKDLVHKEDFRSSGGTDPKKRSV